MRQHTAYLSGDRHRRRLFVGFPARCRSILVPSLPISLSLALLRGSRLIYFSWSLRWLDVGCWQTPITRTRCGIANGRRFQVITT